MSLPRPVIFGEVLFDHFPDGSVVLGGAPFNVAWHLRAFGLDPLFISRVGDDPPGRRIRAAMRDWGMDTAGLQLDSSHETGTVRVRITDGQPSFDIVAGRAYDFIDGGAIPPIEASVLYHGSLALRDAVSDQALQSLKQRLAAPTFVDVNLRPPWWQRDKVLALLREARWVKLSEDELAQLVPGETGLEAQADALLGMGSLELIIVTRGSAGALARTEDQSLEIAPAAGIHVVDAVGAGDAFASVLILGLSLDWALSDILDRAQTFASAVVGVRGATIQDPAFYRPFHQTWGLQTP